MATCLDVPVVRQDRRYHAGVRASCSLVLFLFILSPACDDSPADTDVGDLIDDTEVVDDLPYSGANDPFHIDVRCARCHLVSELTVTYGDDDMSAGRWLASRGEGLVRFDPTGPLDGEIHLQVEWVPRGRHDDASSRTCSLCHPVFADGRGHTSSAYPEAAQLLAHATGGQDCAVGCHVWLGEEQLARRFPDADGQLRLVAVAAKPGDLLTGSENAHSALWRDGYVPNRSDPAVRSGIVAPGCAGCHNFRLEGHGLVATCTDCHAFGASSGQLHNAHLAAIEAGRAANDPAHTDRDPCLYCHDFNDPDVGLPDRTYRAACYNCHLSGHQPVDADGQVHFWPM